MYGLIGRLHVVPGRRKKLGKLLKKAISDARGCISYTVTPDPEDDEVLWVTEVWSSHTSHRRSMDRPDIRKAVKKGKKFVLGGYGTHIHV